MTSGFYLRVPEGQELEKVRGRVAFAQNTERAFSKPGGCTVDVPPALSGSAALHHAGWGSAPAIPTSKQGLAFQSSGVSGYQGSQHLPHR